MRFLTLLLALPVIAAGQVPVGGQAPVRDQPPAAVEQTTGTGRITVVVVADDTGAPVKRLRLALHGVIVPPRPTPGSGPMALASFVEVSPAAAGASMLRPGRVQREAETDEAGRAEFTGLPAASYNVFAQAPPAGFVRQTSSQSLPLKDGESASMAIRLTRAGAIAGRVVDEAGDPLSRVYVRAVRKDPGYGLPRLSAAGTMGTTDDRGEFRLYDLPPGEYFVSAALMNQSSFSPQSQPAGPKAGYLPTFFPGVGGIDGAQAVSVKSGQDTGGIHFGMLRGMLGRVVGVALDAAGAPISTRRGGVSLSSRSREFGGSSRSGWVQDDGRFVVSDVAPGDYYLAAWSAGAGADPRDAGAMVNREGAVVPVSVNGDEVAVDIRTNLGATVSGRVVREGPMPPPPSAPGLAARMPPPQAMRVFVGTRPPTSGAMTPSSSAGRSAYAEDDGTFQLTGLRGTLMLTASSGVGVVKSIRKGATDLLGAPLELTGTERIEDIEIVLTTEVGSLTGTVTGPDGKPLAGAWVVVFPEDSKLWFQPFVSVSRTAEAPSAAKIVSSAVPGAAAGAGSGVGPAGRAPGQFAFFRLKAGVYLVAVVGDLGVNSMPPLDPEFLATLRPKATTVTVAVGETATVHLK